MKAKRESVGNEGADCITNPEHGPTLVLRGGREWCPHQRHDGHREAKRKPTPSFLDKQVIADDQSERPQSA